VGSKLRRKYGPAQTPLDRVLASEVFDQDRVAALQALRRRLDPFQLSCVIDRKLERVYALADRRLAPERPGHRLHSKWRDECIESYILKWLDRHRTLLAASEPLLHPLQFAH